MIDHNTVDFSYGALLMADFNSCKKQFRKEQIEAQKTPQNLQFRASHSGKTLEYANSIHEQRQALQRECDLASISLSPSSFFPDAGKHVFYYDDYEISKILFENAVANDTKNKLIQLIQTLKEENKTLDEKLNEKGSK